MAVGNLLREAIAWLGGVRRAHASSRAVYRRDGDAVELLATPSRSKAYLLASDGLAIQSRDVDWKFLASDLVLGGMQTLPRLRDRLEVSAGDSVAVYEVIDDGTGCYRLDGYGTTLRVHTKLVNARQA